MRVSRGCSAAGAVDSSAGRFSRMVWSPRPTSCNPCTKEPGCAAILASRSWRETVCAVRTWISGLGVCITTSENVVAGALCFFELCFFELFCFEQGAEVSGGASYGVAEKS